MQTAIAVLCIVLAAAYAAWRVYKTFAQHDNPCAGCTGCSLKQPSEQCSHRQKRLNK